MYDIVIIGAGTAGLTAGIYAARSNKKVLIIEASSFGGQIINSNKIDNYPGLYHISGFDYSKKLYDQAISLGCDYLNKKALEFNKLDNYFEVNTIDDVIKTKSIILAVGVTNRKLNLENEDKFIGKGISYCATCDGNFFRNKDVAVIGGGNTALDDALYLSDICNKVYLVHRRDSFSGSSSTLDKLREKDNVSIIVNSTVNELIGEDKLDGISLIDNLGNNKIINVSCLFVAIGQIPENNNLLKDINVDNNGYIITDDEMHTNISHIYASGDIRSKNLRQLVTASSDGAIAAVTAIKELN